ncbi:GNAT family N-acetyltransferase [Azomonas macrocytogenes]|uniref:RimJ/RimL family protein N-acetyltransferase n=1 Tax=Azomonas macrocytogenes TaxID=69962 RepID=A0A839T117_AZOMA|nr:GNAT family N-acetyltransferase [Azomonas macrocytogenes]MBB3103082.1 RimJ/RimL family protein N-acetyltransferase [Azomonas macrocytogenes]
MIARTTRMLLRPLSQDDLPQLASILGDPQVMHYSVRGPFDRLATRRFIDWCRYVYQTRGIGPWALIDKRSAALIGYCGVGPDPVDGCEEINLGYRLARRFWGMGLATEAVTCVLQHGFAQPGIDSIIAIIAPTHLASQRVAEKAGFNVFQRTFFHGLPVRLYRMTHEEWRTQYAPESGVSRSCSSLKSLMR